MTRDRWAILSVGGRSARNRDVRMRVVDLLAAFTLVPSAMTLREEDGPQAYDSSIALELEPSFPGPLVLTGRPDFEAIFWLGDQAQIRLDLPPATADALGDALARTITPDLMWAWPQWVGGSPEADRFMSDVGPEQGEGTFRGWGARTWLSPDWAQRLLPADIPEPVRVTRVSEHLIRVDLAPDVHDRDAVLAGHAGLAGESSVTSPPGRKPLAASEVARRAAPHVVLDRVESHDADLRRRALDGSSWRGALIVDTDFDAATLTHAVFDEAQLDQVSFRDCNAQDASFVASDLVSSFLDRAVLSRADLRGASIVNCEMAGTIAREANFEAALLEDSRLVGADLSGARLYRATLRRCDLSGARLSGVDLSTTTMEDCTMG